MFTRLFWVHATQEFSTDNYQTIPGFKTPLFQGSIICTSKTLIKRPIILFTAILTLKTDIDSWHSRRMSIQTCFHRPSLPNVDIRRGSRFSDPLLRGPYSAKSSFSDKNLSVHSKYTRMSIDSSPVTHLLRETRQVNSSPISVRNEEEMRLEIKRNVFAWQKKEYSLIPRRSPQLSRSKTVYQRRASSDDADNIYRRHTIDSPRLQHIFQIIWWKQRLNRHVGPSTFSFLFSFFKYLFLCICVI